MEEARVGTPDGRRHTRAALAEIPARLGQLRVSPLLAVTNTPAVLPHGYLSPTPSPDELVIQQRGRRRLPTTWSPDIDFKRNSAFHSTIRTPPKNIPAHLSPTKTGITLRSTPRKRLLLDTERIPLTPEKIDFTDISTPQKLKLSPVKGPPPVKRLRIEHTEQEKEFKGPLEVAFKGLSHSQLQDLLKKVMGKHPELEQEIRSELPAPDLKPLEEKLNYLKSNIFKSLPTSRLTSKTDSPAYSRVSTHLNVFKKCVLEQAKNLVESQQWSSVLEYVFLCWSYVKATPVWDNHPHNTHRRQCFKALASHAMGALRKGDFDKSKFSDFQDKFQGMVADSEDVHSCLKYVQTQLQGFF